MVRRVAALAIGVLVLVLLVLLVNGCLNNRQEQALKDYNRDVAGIVRDADTNADAVYDTLSSGGQASTDVQSEINQLRVRAQTLTKQAEGIDVPGDMRPAHRNVLLSLSLLREAMGKIAEKLPAALSTDSATAVPAVRSIAGEFQAFDAANVVYNRRGAALIKEVLDDKEIGGQTIQNSSFVQNYGWLQPSTVARRINSTAGRGAGDAGTTEPAPGLHGHGLLGVSVGDVTLVPGQPNQLRVASNVTFSVKVANQGDNAETEVRVRVRISGAGDPISVQRVIDQTTAKSETTASVPLGQAPPEGEAVQIRVEVVPVPGEENKTNNSATYPAIFRRG
jgi:hypothetical protein